METLVSHSGCLHLLPNTHCFSFSVFFVMLPSNKVTPSSVLLPVIHPFENPVSLISVHITYFQHNTTGRQQFKVHLFTAGHQ